MQTDDLKWNQVSVRQWQDKNKKYITIANFWNRALEDGVLYEELMFLKEIHQDLLSFAWSKENPLDWNLLPLESQKSWAKIIWEDWSANDRIELQSQNKHQAEQWIARSLARFNPKSENRAMLIAELLRIVESRKAGQDLTIECIKKWLILEEDAVIEQRLGNTIGSELINMEVLRWIEQESYKKKNDSSNAFFQDKDKELVRKWVNYYTKKARCYLEPNLNHLAMQFQNWGVNKVYGSNQDPLVDGASDLELFKTMDWQLGIRYLNAIWVYAIIQDDVNVWSEFRSWIQPFIEQCRPLWEDLHLKFGSCPLDWAWSSDDNHTMMSNVSHFMNWQSYGILGIDGEKRLSSLYAKSANKSPLTYDGMRVNIASFLCSERIHAQYNATQNLKKAINSQMDSVLDDGIRNSTNTSLKAYLTVNLDWALEHLGAFDIAHQIKGEITLEADRMHEKKQWYEDHQKAWIKHSWADEFRFFETPLKDDKAWAHYLGVPNWCIEWMKIIFVLQKWESTYECNGMWKPVENPNFKRFLEDLECWESSLKKKNNADFMSEFEYWTQKMKEFYQSKLPLHASESGLEMEYLNRWTSLRHKVFFESTLDQEGIKKYKLSEKKDLRL